MKLLIKQRVFSWGDSYDVYDEYGNVKYVVKAEVFSIGHQLHVYDAAQREIGIIHEKVFRFLPAFEIEVAGEMKGRIEKQFTFFKPKYEINYNGWRVEGDFLGWNYDVYEGCSAIIQIRKELLQWGDTYVIEYGNPEQELDALLLVIAIDAANCQR